MKPTKACRPRKLCAKPSERRFETVDDVVAAYIRVYRDGAATYLKWFKRLPSLETAIDKAALCKLPSNKRHPHQYRIRNELLQVAKTRLLACKCDLKKCQSFIELHDLVAGRLGALKGIGQLTVYDIALRIGAHLGLEPELIYLHAGVANGARALRLGVGQATLHPDELPAAFRKFKPYEIEDCLCIYKDTLKIIATR